MKFFSFLSTLGLVGITYLFKSHKDSYTQEINELKNENNNLNNELKKLKEEKTFSVIQNPVNIYSYEHCPHLIEREIERAERYSLKLALLSIQCKCESETKRSKLIEIINDSIRTIDILFYSNKENEFVVFCTETDADLANKISERILKNVHSKIDLSLKIGITTYPDDATSYTNLLEHSKQAMIDAKNNSILKFSRDY